MRYVIIYKNRPLGSFDLWKRSVKIFILEGRVLWRSTYPPSLFTPPPRNTCILRWFLVSSRTVVLEQRSVLLIGPWHFNYWLLLIYKLPIYLTILFFRHSGLWLHCGTRPLNTIYHFKIIDTIYICNFSNMNVLILWITNKAQVLSHLEPINNLIPTLGGIIV